MLTPKHLYNKRIVVGEDDRVGPWVYARTGGGPWSSVGCTTVGLEREGELIAGVVYERWNYASICMHVASDGTKRWLNREYLRFCFHYPFRQLKVRKVIGMVPGDNADALRFDKHLGFVEEARIKDACPGGDLVLLTMTADQCRWLKE